MPKLITANMLDAVLDKIALCDRLTVCSGEPESIEDIQNLALAVKAIEPADFAKSDFSEEIIVYNSAGEGAAITVTGRQIALAAQNEISITAEGDSAFIVLDDGTDFIGTPCDTQSLVPGGKLNLPVTVIKQRDPE